MLTESFQSIEIGCFRLTRPDAVEEIEDNPGPDSARRTGPAGLFGAEINEEPREGDRAAAGSEDQQTPGSEVSTKRTERAEVDWRVEPVASEGHAPGTAEMGGERLPIGTPAGDAVDHLTERGPEGHFGDPRSGDGARDAHHLGARRVGAGAMLLGPHEQRDIG
jgi:hypothetical protein